MDPFEKINEELGVAPLTPVEMNSIHLSTGEHSTLADTVPGQGMKKNGA